MRTLLLLLPLAFCLLISSTSATAPHMSSNADVERRGFKSSLLSTARGFGKRDAPFLGARVPVSMVEEEATRNPQLLAMLVRALDTDNDGWISAYELMAHE